MRFYRAILLAFIIGMQARMFCNSKRGADLGYKAEVWTRQMLGLPPVNDSKVASTEWRAIKTPSIYGPFPPTFFGRVVGKLTGHRASTEGTSRK